MATFVLVHGMSWRMMLEKKTPLVSRAGHNVYTPTRTGLGERSHLATRDTGLDTNMLDIIQVLEYENLNEIFWLVIVMED